MKNEILTIQNGGRPQRLAQDLKLRADFVFQAAKAVEDHRSPSRWRVGR
jgi:hypothetical protein